MLCYRADADDDEEIEESDNIEKFLINVIISEIAFDFTYYFRIAFGGRIL